MLIIWAMVLPMLSHWANFAWGVLHWRQLTNSLDALKLLSAHSLFFLSIIRTSVHETWFVSFLIFIPSCVDFFPLEQEIWLYHLVFKLFLYINSVYFHLPNCNVSNMTTRILSFHNPLKLQMCRTPSWFYKSSTNDCRNRYCRLSKY